jgi:hypothetical protein
MLRSIQSVLKRTITTDSSRKNNVRRGENSTKRAVVHQRHERKSAQQNQADITIILLTLTIENVEEHQLIEPLRSISDVVQVCQIE